MKKEKTCPGTGLQLLIHLIDTNHKINHKQNEWKQILSNALDTPGDTAAAAARVLLHSGNKHNNNNNN